MRLETAEIDRYGPLYDWRPPCREGLTVLSGPNEAGKTLYLEALLQLLDPAVDGVMDPPPRVNDSPTGRIVVEHAGERHELDGDVCLDDVCGIEPRHLHNVFVVRDSDLELPGEREYYTSLIEKLGDIHTTEIEKIDAALKDRGRLTSTTLKVSSSRQHDSAGDVRDAARGLADEIREYTETIEAEGLDEMEGRRLRVKRQLRDVRQQLQDQKEARTVAEYEHLSEQLETYRTTSERLAELAGFDREPLDSMRERRNDLERDREDLRELEREIEAKEAAVERKSDELEDRNEQRSRLERREDAVSNARSKLNAFRGRQDDAAGAERRLALTRATTIGGLLAGGGAGIAGSIAGSLPAVGLGVVALLVAIVSGVAYHRANERLAAVESSRASALQAARDAGFDVEVVEAVAPAIESFEQQLKTVRERAAKAEQEHEDTKADLGRLRDEKSDLEARIEEGKEELEGNLDDAGVETIEAYERTVERREELEGERRTARQSLVDSFGEAAGEDPGTKAADWEESLEAYAEGVDVDAVDAETYDEAELQRLSDERERLAEEREKLEATLQEHDERLDDFADRVRNIDTKPFVGEQVSLESQSREGLERLADELDAVVERIEDDASVSRKAIEVFERIGQQEAQKLTDLFDPEGPASRTFEWLTDGRYATVAYDADAHDIQVSRNDGRRFTPDVLSHGTRDQLYFATRVSLAEQLLGSEPGFFLLDDPFLAADPDRLHQGFRALQQLADAGWQILYLTAKGEVSETMVAEYDLDHVEVESLSLGA